MSLNWNLSEIQNYEEVCFLLSPDDIPTMGIKAGERVMNPVTNVLIWATMAVDLPGITEDNAAEFFARLRFTEQLDGPMLIRAEDENGVRPSGVKAFITEEEVLAHVGLACNVSPRTRAQWMKRFDKDVSSLARRFKSKREQIRDAAALEAGQQG